MSLNAMFNLMQYTIRVRSAIIALAIITLFAASAHAQGDKVTVAFSDPLRPGTLKVSLIAGSITVKAYEGKDVVVESRSRTGEKSSGRAAGMKRIPMTATGMTVEEEDNKVTVSADSHQRAIDITVLVPAKTSLYLRCVNDGDIEVTGVDGEIDVNNVNGEVTLKNVAGNVVAHALNGDVKVNFTSINAKPMAFSSLNGDIDVTFPATLKANVVLTSTQGEVYSDFDVAMQATAPKQTVEDNRDKGGKYRVKIEKAIQGTINGGGPEIRFKNFNGDIFIRKAGGGL